MRKQTADFNLVRNINKSIVLNKIATNEPISRADIARITKLNPATVANIVKELMKDDLVREIGKGESNGGKCPILLALNPQSFCQVGVHIVDRIAGGVVDLKGNTLSYIEYQFNKEEKLEIDLVIKSIYEAIEESGISLEKVKGIGIGVTGLINSSSGIVEFAPNIGWENVHLKNILEEEFNIPVYIDNDVKATAIGELWFGVAQGKRNFIVFDIGSGIGSALVIEGKIYRGANGRAGEIGHTFLRYNPIRCKCGNYGCLETFVNDKIIIEKIKSEIRTGGKSLILDLIDNIENITLETIFDAVRKNDTLTNKIIQNMGEDLGLVIANTINTLDPELIILNGYLTTIAGDLLIPIIQQSIRKHIFGKTVKIPEIIVGKLCYLPKCIGPAALVLQKEFSYLKKEIP
ncbi:MAG: ROK family transcriptional regulator [bacterium]|nr:ROK family transcriptional regulator [bacterium]